MANKTKIIEYTFIEKEDDGHNNKTHKITKKAIFLDPRDSESGVGFLIIKSGFGNGPYVIYLTIEGEIMNSFCFGDNFGIEGFPIPGQPNSDSWNEIKILSPENLLLDGQVKTLTSYFEIASSYYATKKMIWEIFKNKL